MADPFSIGAGAIGVASLSIQLLGGCIKGFVLLTTAQNLGKDASTIVCMLNLQEIQLINWAERAGLLSGDGVLDRRLNAAAVEESLERLKELLQNTDNLKVRYGLSLVQRNINHETSASKDCTLPNKARVFTAISSDTRHRIFAKARLAQDTDFMRRLWWAAIDKEKVEKLIADVQFLVRGLWHLLNPLLGDDLAGSMKSILSYMVKMNDGFEQLMSIKDVLGTIQKGAKPDQDTEIKSLVTATEMKALQCVLSRQNSGTSSGSSGALPKRQEALQKLERLSRQRLMSFNPLKKNDRMGLGVYNGENVFIEWKKVNPALRSKILPRAENLAALLNMEKDQTFQSLQCRGLIEDDDKLGFVFYYPALCQTPAEPRSLLDLFSAKGGIEPPSLSDRIRLALRVAQVVQNFHQTGWLHKGLQSRNILFFDTVDTSVAVHNADFVLAGFNFSRFGAPTEISEQPSEDPRQDIYRHPNALGQPTVSFDESMDVYSLGTILLEIAEWRALQYLVDSVVDVAAENVPLERLAAIRQFLLESQGKGGTSKLRFKVGDIYASACLMCLRGKAEESESQARDGASQQDILEEVIRRLQSCCV